MRPHHPRLFVRPPRPMRSASFYWSAWTKICKSCIKPVFLDFMHKEMPITLKSYEILCKLLDKIKLDKVSQELQVKARDGYLPEYPSCIFFRLGKGFAIIGHRWTFFVFARRIDVSLCLQWLTHGFSSQQFVSCWAGDCAFTVHEWKSSFWGHFQLYVLINFHFVPRSSQFYADYCFRCWSTRVALPLAWIGGLVCSSFRNAYLNCSKILPEYELAAPSVACSAVQY